MPVLREHPGRDSGQDLAGRLLTRELRGYHSARRGAYRVIYRIDETKRIVNVVRIDHRADVYRTQ